MGQVESAPPRGGSESSTVLRQLPPAGPEALYLWAEQPKLTQKKYYHAEQIQYYMAQQQKVTYVIQRGGTKLWADL